LLAPKTASVPEMKMPRCMAAIFLANIAALDRAAGQPLGGVDGGGSVCPSEGIARERLGMHHEMAARRECGFEFRVASNLAADVANDVSEPGAQPTRLPVVTVELFTASLAAAIIAARLRMRRVGPPQL
jgi:hypothetical protein